jgi:hypothetical protein
MTLLISVANPEYSLIVSDQRITVTYPWGTKTMDERFNKTIHFGTEDYVGSISYTGMAQWEVMGAKIRLYDLISEAVSPIIADRPKLAELCLHVVQYLERTLPTAKTLGREPIFELHIVTREKAVPVNTITVISTFREGPPWGASDGYIYEWQLGPIAIFMKVLVDECEVIFGGMEPSVLQAEKDLIREAVRSGATAFDATQMAGKIVTGVSLRTPTVGPTSVSIVIPQNGYVDTNLYGHSKNQIIGFVPRMVFSNGNMFGPSEFPVDLNILSQGQLPKQSLFFKSIVCKEYKKRTRSLIFRRRKGPLIPGLLGLIGLSLFGSVAEGHDDFGLGIDTDE